MTQTTLTGDESGSGDGSDEQTTADTEDMRAASTVSTSNEHALLAPPEQRGGDGCCPWCLASPETFVEHDNGRVGCGHCSASIPVGVEWYENGEKIVVGPEPRDISGSSHKQ